MGKGLKQEYDSPILINVGLVELRNPKEYKLFSPVDFSLANYYMSPFLLFTIQDALSLLI